MSDDILSQDQLSNMTLLAVQILLNDAMTGLVDGKIMTAATAIKDASAKITDRLNKYQESL
jgi:hypothetical protein